MVGPGDKCSSRASFPSAPTYCGNAGSETAQQSSQITDRTSHNTKNLDYLFREYVWRSRGFSAGTN